MDFQAAGKSDEGVGRAIQASASEKSPGAETTKDKSGTLPISLYSNNKRAQVNKEYQQNFQHEDEENHDMEPDDEQDENDIQEEVENHNDSEAESQEVDKDQEDEYETDSDNDAQLNEPDNQDNTVPPIMVRSNFGRACCANVRLQDFVL